MGGVFIFFMPATRVVCAAPGGSSAPPQGGEPLIVPLAVPLIAGPSALATVMLMATRDPANVAMWAGALTAAMALTAVVLLAGARLQRWMGEPAMQAVERLTGLILTAIAVEMLLGGVREF